MVFWTAVAVVVVPGAYAAWRMDRRRPSRVRPTADGEIARATAAQQAEVNRINLHGTFGPGV